MKAATGYTDEAKKPLVISIHAAREGGDTMLGRPVISLFLFQSTPPVKAATQSTSGTFRVLVISIHAAREGGDAPADRRG